MEMFQLIKGKYLQLTFLLFYSFCLIKPTYALDLDVPKSFFYNEEVWSPTQSLPIPSGPQRKLIIVIGNDGFSANRSDEHFTNRFRIGQITKRVPKALQKFIDNENFLIMTMTQEIYTPADLKEDELIKDDRPYAGWLYFTLGEMKQTETQLTINTIDLGVVGPSSQADSTQIEFHNLFNSVEPDGWDHQLRDELGIKFNHERYFKTSHTLNSYITLELMKFYGFNLGNIETSAKTGGIIRVGYNIPDDFLYGINKNQNNRWSVFTFIKVEGKYVLRNIFLDGNTYKDSHSVDKENIVAKIVTGLTLIKGNIGFSITQNITSKEFEEQTDLDTYAELSFIFNVKF